MKKQSSELEWLKTKAGYLKIYQIEIELNMPEGTLKKFVDGNRTLAEHWHKPVITWIKKFKK
jgi:hypothetical protein